VIGNRFAITTTPANSTSATTAVTAKLTSEGFFWGPGPGKVRFPGLDAFDRK
jgi:hypothetical protein